ncbi:MAG TPA: histidine kinase dimerization/phospho-acceptor domain-containing protein, partial [Gemmatimonadaceae bacterium]|nr:histidine kinase dimerization/phospho-acceptor domain-containing protein [Gemmatimonadaceae bacterium]
MTDTLSQTEGARTADEPPAPLPRTDIAVLRVDPGGRVLFSNGLLERGLGRPAGALVGHRLDDLLDERCRAQVVNALKTSDSSAPVLDDVRFADGRVSTMNGAFQVARDQDGIWLVRLPTAPQAERVRDDLAERNRDLARSNSDLAKAIEQLKEQKDDLERQQEQLLEQATELEMQTEELEAQKEELARQAESLAEARRRAEAQADEYRHVSDLLHKANEQLEERAQALRDATEAKSRFLATMSHELRTPLNAVLGYSGLLRDGVYGSMTQAQERAILNIVRRAKDLQLLIDDVLDLSKIEAGRMELRYEDFDPRTIVAEVEETIAPLAGEKALRVTTNLASAPASV